MAYNREARALNEGKVSNFYDYVWTHYIPDYSESEKHWAIFFAPGEVKDKNILDAGCGTGIFSIIFARKGAKKVTGIDISEGSLKTAQRLKRTFNIQNAEFRKEDMLRLPFKDEDFDIVWAWGAAHHTTDPLKAIEELMRVLKKKGTLLIALYTKTRLTSIHEITRKALTRTPRFTWKCITKFLAFLLNPMVVFFKKREKSRKGEKLEELILDWYFVPRKHFYLPDKIKTFLKERGFVIEKFLPASGRFNSTSNFVFKARKR